MPLYSAKSFSKSCRTPHSLRPTDPKVRRQPRSIACWGTLTKQRAAGSELSSIMGERKRLLDPRASYLEPGEKGIGLINRYSRKPLYWRVYHATVNRILASSHSVLSARVLLCPGRP